MHGNVWEWCSAWHATGDNSESPRSDPTGSSEGSNRVGRGGGWTRPAKNCWSEYRERLNPSERNSGQGFRVVLEPVDVLGK